MTQLIESAMFLSFMAVIAVVDWRKFVIPNALVIAGLVGGVLLRFSFQREQLVDSLIFAVVCLGIMAVVRSAGNLMFRREAMGMGDVKLAALLGFYLGIEGFLLTLWVGAILGSVYGMIATAKMPDVILRSEATKDLTIQDHQILPATKMAGGHFVQNDITARVVAGESKIPFGSFLAVSSVLVMFFQTEIKSWLMSLQ